MHERVKYIASKKECPDELLGAISALIWAGERVEIAEMEVIRKQFTYKYGAKFALAARNNENNIVEERLVNKLSVKAPSRDLVGKNYHSLLLLNLPENSNFCSDVSHPILNIESNFK